MGVMGIVQRDPAARTFTCSSEQMNQFRYRYKTILIIKTCELLVAQFLSKGDDSPEQLADSSCRLPATTALHLSLDAPLRTLRPNLSLIYPEDSITVLLHFVSFLNESKFCSTREDISIDFFSFSCEQSLH